MKKIISLIIITLLLATLVLTGYSYAASLDTLTVDVDKTTVRPGEEVKVTINFGTDLGAYTFDIKYDNNLKCTQDYDFYLNVLSHKLKLLLIPDALVFYRIYPDAEKPDNLRDYSGEFMILRHKYNNPVLWG